MAAAFKEAYDKTKVFDPSKVQAPPPTPLQTGLAVQPGQGVSTTAGAGYYTGRTALDGSTDPSRAAALAPKTAPPVVGKGDPLAAVKAKATNAGLTPDMVQDKAAPPLPAGVKEFSFNKALRAGGTVANNSRSDWSDGSRNAVANMAGKSYAEQVAQADKVNAANALGALSPKEAAEAGIMKAQELLATSKSRSVRKGFNATAFANAAGGVAGAQDRMSRAKTLFDTDQNTKLASMKDATEKYKVDQDVTSRRDVAELNRAGNLETAQAQLEAQKYTADATARNALETAAAARQQKQAEILATAANYNPENDLAFQAIADPAARQKYLDEMGYNRLNRAADAMRNTPQLLTPPKAKS